MKKVVYISGTRADFGLMRRTLQELNKHIDLTIIVTGMHLYEEWGYTVKEIENYNFKTKKLKIPLSGDGLGDMAKSLGILLDGLTECIEKLKPDLIFVEGDRGEALAGAIVGAHLNIPIIHHGGGDKSDSIDNKIRYAITTFSDYHFVGNKQSYERLRKYEIPEDRIFNVGEPGIDDIIENNFTPKKEIIKEFEIMVNKPLLLLIFHPNTKEYDSVKIQILQIMEAIKDLKIDTIGLYANADAGGNIINLILDKFQSELEFLKIYKHFSREVFLGLMNVCSSMIGNSSSGIIELPSFKKPFICIGTRQKGRLRADNVIDIGYDKEEITKAIHKALYDENFKKNLKNLKNPYGAGKAYLHITKLILQILGINFLE